MAVNQALDITSYYAILTMALYEVQLSLQSLLTFNKTKYLMGDMKQKRYIFKL